MYSYCDVCEEFKAEGIRLVVWEYPDEDVIAWEDCTFCCEECHPEKFEDVKTLT